MNIRYLYPRAGHEFPFYIDDFHGLVVWHIALSNQALATGQCADPPCHEVMRVSDSAEGEPLIISLSHFDSETQRTEQRSIALDVGRSNDPERWEELRW